MPIFMMETNNFKEILYTLIKYAELVWGFPFNWTIYKISAKLHVKQVKNYSMKRLNADCVQQGINIFQ